MDIKNLDESIVFNENSFTKRIIYSTDNVLCFILNFKPGQSLPVHRHENSSLVVINLSGSGEVKINDEIAKITKGSVIMAKGQDDFSIPTVSEDLSVLVTISPNPSNQMYSKNFG